MGTDRRVAPSAPVELLGRSREVAALQEFLDDAARLPAAVEILGEPGIGKTTLWRHAIDSAAGRGYQVMVARPARSESQLVFAGLGDLLGSAYAVVASELPERQRRALDAALLLDQPSTDSPDQRTVGVALLSVLRLLTRRGSLLVAIDDAQWLDGATATIVGFALRRLEREPVAVVVARRSTGDDGVARLDTRLPTLELRLGPLSVGALHAILVERFHTVLTRPRLRRLHDLAGGNPLLALELMKAVEAGRLRLDATEQGAADLDRLLGARLGALPRLTQRALLAVAAASRPTVDLVSRVLNEDAAPVLQPAVEADIIQLSGQELRFTHPLLASAAYDTAAAERRWVHAALAGQATDPVERARHAALAAEEADERVAAEVAAAAAATLARGAPAAAADLAALAVQLTPIALETERRQRTLTHAEGLFLAGDTAAAAAILDGLVKATPAGPPRAPMLALLARVQHFANDIASGVALHRQALAEAGGDDLLLANVHEGLAWGLFLMREDLHGAARHAQAAVEAAERAGNDVALAEALAAKALTSLAVGGRADEALERAMALEPRMLDLRVLRHASYARGYFLACTDQLDAARAIFAELLERAEERGDESAVPPILVQLSMVEIVAGKWATAEEHASTGYALALQGGQRPSQSALLGRLALLAVLRGELDVAETRGLQALALASDSDEPQETLAKGPTTGGEAAIWALGAAALAAGIFDRAHHFLGALADTLLDAGMKEPGEMRFLPDAVEALLGLGRIDEADTIVTQMEAMVDGSGRDTAFGVAARCRALIHSRRGDSEDALAAAERAVDLLAGGTLPLERARSLLVLGEIRRQQRQKRAARESLEAARAAFEELQARGWVARAASQLARIGGRPVASGALTASEARVAELVSEGLSNKEVAHVLGIAPKTVELHLSHVYAKLSVGSRTELVRFMASPAALAPDSQA